MVVEQIHRSSVYQEADLGRSRVEVTDLLYRFYAALDEHRFDDLGRFLSADVQAVTPGGEVSGREAVLALATRTHADYARLHHAATNVLVDVDVPGDRAEIRTNVLATFGRDDLRPERRLGTVSRFGARREGGGWLIDRIGITPVWMIEDVAGAA
jgi:hypothetical protein